MSRKQLQVQALYKQTPERIRTKLSKGYTLLLFVQSASFPGGHSHWRKLHTTSTFCPVNTFPWGHSHCFPRGQPTATEWRYTADIHSYWHHIKQTNTTVAIVLLQNTADMSHSSKTSSLCFLIETHVIVK